MFEPHRAFLNRPRIRYELRVNDLKYERHRNVQFIAVKRSRQKQTGVQALPVASYSIALGPFYLQKWARGTPARRKQNAINQ